MDLKKEQKKVIEVSTLRFNVRGIKSIAFNSALQTVKVLIFRTMDTAITKQQTFFGFFIHKMPFSIGNHPWHT